ncbi:MAG: hypothetical protein NVS2B4_19850 [Ramlibacter sp.]
MPGISGLEYITGANTPIVPMNSGSPQSVAMAVCPAGKKVIGGGYVLSGGFGATIMRNGPLPDSNAWAVYIQSMNAAGDYEAYAVCAIVP